ncbi:MAG: sugar ABC transporter ATP-binding protein [Fimbriimonadales bacterium]
MSRLEVQNIVMEFPAVRALDGVSVAFKEGEVHGIVGENGAGKSTLMKILGGLLHATSGTILLDDKPAMPTGVRDALKHGIAMIHQELNLVDELTVAENVFLGREITKAGLLDRAKMIEETENHLRQIHANFSAAAKVGDLSIAGKQLVEIAKAVAVDASILIMDEPTAVLSEPEAESLFELIAKLRERGTTVLYISHRLTEVCAICDRITVLRDGAKIATVDAKGANPAAIADLMVGRPLSDFYPPKTPAPEGDPVLEIKNVCGAGFSVRAGEILGLAGLVGAGRTELAEAIVGARPRSSPLQGFSTQRLGDAEIRGRVIPGHQGSLGLWASELRNVGPKPDDGEIRVNGAPCRIRSPKEAMKHGIAYVSEDRKVLGLHLSLSVIHNVTLANLRAYGDIVPSRQKERESAKRWKRDLDIRAGDLDDAVLNVSGGNQQKIAIAKWLETKPKVLILDEPTRGVDVGAKREMYNLIQHLASEGMACIVISSELPEIIGLCHRAIVMREGRIVGELSGNALTEEAVMRLAAGVQAA